MFIRFRFVFIIDIYVNLLFKYTQIIAVNGISLLNLSYNESLRLLQNTGRVVELIVSQIIFMKNIKNVETKTKEELEILKRNELVVCGNQNGNLINSSSVIRSPSNNQSTEIYENCLVQTETNENYHKEADNINNNKNMKIIVSSNHSCKFADAANNEADLQKQWRRSDVVGGVSKNGLVDFSKWQKISPAKSLPNLPKVRFKIQNKHTYFLYLLLSLEYSFDFFLSCMGENDLFRFNMIY